MVFSHSDWNPGLGDRSDMTDLDRVLKRAIDTGAAAGVVASVASREGDLGEVGQVGTGKLVLFLVFEERGFSFVQPPLLESDPAKGEMDAVEGRVSADDGVQVRRRGFGFPTFQVKIGEI